MAQQIDKDYAYLKLCSIKPSITFTPSKARRAMRAKLATYQATIGENRLRQEANYKLLLALEKSIAKSKKINHSSLTKITLILKLHMNNV